MADTVDKATRSRIMARVRSKNTTQELRLRHALHARGLRYRLHDATLPGTPDLVLPGPKTVVFVNGCQWHWHGCTRSRMPATNRPYWEAKIARNQARDQANLNALVALGWRVLIVWECALKSSLLDSTADEGAEWIRTDNDGATVHVIPGASVETAGN
ncbi:DNA mismatch endonuclease Vsr [Dyella solisilvae]|uniref:DNA mismatch endonuclease Vsr n=1 Tax=Dyella solisilvae TaxID=1920168 RepID=A0A370KBL5_9GAMM|nr:very short patch repair endonuclease [Dyella solisilvae]RDI99460.1 DNA mismatch endonuclease Vsr [Dyella solisilvae]